MKRFHIWKQDKNATEHLNHISAGPYTKVALPQILNGSSVLNQRDNLITDLRKQRYFTTLIQSSPPLRDISPLFDQNIDVFQETKGKLLGELNKKYHNHPMVRAFCHATGLGYRRAETMLKEAEKHLVNNERDSFTWIHLMDPHIPWQPPNWNEVTNKNMLKQIQSKLRLSNYQKPSITQKEKEIIKKLYQGEVEYLDLELTNFLEKTKVDFLIITADHGDLLGEYGHYSHPGLWVPELLHVPYITWGPESRSFNTVKQITTHAQIRENISKIAHAVRL